MTALDLFEKVETHEELEGAGIIMETTDGPTVVVRHKPTAMLTQFPVKAIKELSWEQLEPVLTCKHEPAVLQHIARVCGYFSRVSNWNQSKVGELKDRHKGVYSMPEPTASC